MALARTSRSQTNGSLQEELHRIAIHHLDAVHGLQELALRIPWFGQEALKGKFHILGHQLAAVDRRFIVPVHPLAQMKDIGGVVRRFPAFGQVGLDA